jgi:nitrate/TMAO reductase-like tetraheme cytochrome c subunit
MMFRKSISVNRLVPGLLIALGLGILAFSLAPFITHVQAAPAIQDDSPTNDFCLACHQQEEMELKFKNEAVSAAINPTEFKLSVHAEENIKCVDCHTEISDYPHPPVQEKTSRDFSLTMLVICKDCHEEQAVKVQDSVHQNAFNEGNKEAAVCTDCHNPHTQQRLTGKTSGELTNRARINIPEICAQCHSEIYDVYKSSVHGSALLDEFNPDVPTCIDCHGVHNIPNPTTNTFRNSTPYLCATCHTNPDIMNKYGISTNVLNSYVSDFHGTNVKLFTEQYPDQPTNKPVCTDCHGFHEISKVDNPETGIALRENLLVKCQRCHPDATANYPAAWMSHYEASPEHFPIVYYVNLFYQFIIPGIIGGMIFFVITDIYRRRVNRAKGVKHS